MTKQKLHIVIPTSSAWRYATDMLKNEPVLKGINFAALSKAIEEAVSLIEKIKEEKASRTSHRSAKKKLLRLAQILFQLEFHLKAKETQKALREINLEHPMADLLSLSALSKIYPDEDLLALVRSRPLAKLKRKKEILEQNPGVALLSMVQIIREPVDHWIFRNKKNGGGRPVKTPRQAVLFSLMKNYEAIMNRPLNEDGKSVLVAITTHILPACQVSTSGLEKACGRAMEKLATWSVWWHLPPPQSNSYDYPQNNESLGSDDPEMSEVQPKPKRKK